MHARSIRHTWSGSRAYCAGALRWLICTVAATGVAVAQAATEGSARSGAELPSLEIADSTESEPDPVAQCAPCHGADGNSKDSRFPKLAGQDAGYLFSQLWAFRTGARVSEIMSDIAASLSESDADSAARFYAQQTPRPDQVKDEALAAAGERVFFEGTASGTVPACAICHGAPGQRHMMGGMGMMGMGGMMSNAPRLNGQHAAYVVDQLDRFSDGRRQGMMMNRIAWAMTDADKNAVAEYLSGLP